MPISQIATVILTWNNVQYTLDCLQSLAQQSYQAHTVYVVDNASTDNTADIVARRFPDVRLIRNRENLGYAAGNNAGLDAAFADGADAVLILNNDATLAPDALYHLASAAESPGVGIVSPTILFAHSPQRVWFAGAAINRWTGLTRHEGYGRLYRDECAKERRIGRATGCAMLITRACYTAIGGFDASLFLYFEDAEYSLRACQAGFSVVLAPRAIAYHHVSVSSGGAKSADAVYYSTRNSAVVLDTYMPLAPPLATMRRLLMALAMLTYITRPPRGTATIQDITAGYRDARRRRTGRRDTNLRRSPYFLRHDPRGAHMRLLEIMPPGERVLDVGCASGYLAQLLRARGRHVVGVEPDPRAAREARDVCEAVFEESAEEMDRLPLSPHSFDIVLFGDVLEHLAHPERAMTGALRLLKPGGYAVVSAPNVAHYSVRFRLLLGRFTYTRDGLLDATHLRFFTRRSICAFARSNGFSIVRYDVTQGSPLRPVGHLLRKIGLEDARVTRFVDACDLRLSRWFPGLFGFQHLLVLRPQRPVGDAEMVA